MVANSGAPSRKSGGKLRWLVIFGCIAAAGYFGWRFYFAQPAARGGMPMDNIPPVRVARVMEGNVPYFLNGLGTVVPSGDVLVQSRVDGQLIKLHFTEGQRVEAGDLLAEIDSRPFKATLEQARGNLEKDKAQLVNARNDLARYAKLAKGDYIAEQQYETQKALVRQYESAVQADQGAVDSALLQIEYSNITAPISGRLGLKVVDEGNQVKANDANGLVRITETSPCDVIFTLPESKIGQIIKAISLREQNPDLPPLVAQAWNREDKELLATGELISVDNQIDSGTGTVKLKARFNNYDRSLFPNQFVNIHLLIETLKDVLTVPAGAAQLGARGSYCYVIKKEERNGAETDIAEYREITPGIVEDGRQVIEKGLSKGELVVVDGIDRLRNDLPVRIAAIMGEDGATGSAEETEAGKPAQNAVQ